MRMKFGLLTGFLVLLGLGLTSCGTSSSTASSGTGILYVTTQGNISVSAYGITLSNGALSTNGNAVATGNKASAIVMTPKGDAAFVANSQDNTISSYTVNPDSTLAVSGNATPAGTTPMGMTIDPGGKFLFVVNQGTFSDPNSGTISVFGVSGAALTAMGSVSTATAGVTTGTGPVSVAITPNGNYLYVANQFTSTVSGYSISSGTLTLLPGSPYAVANQPSAVALTPDGNFLYVANQGSNNLSAFAVCANASLTCTTPTGILTPVPGSPFAAGLAPIAIASAADSHGEYLFVANYGSNELSQFKVGVETGVLTAQSPASISTGANPTSVAVLTGPTTLLNTGGTTNYVYVANITAGTISSFSYDTTLGTLSIVGSALTTSGQPSAIVVR